MKYTPFNFSSASMRRRQFFKNSLPFLALPNIISNLNSDFFKAEFNEEYSKSEVFDNDKILVYVNLMGGLDANDILLSFATYDKLAQVRPSLIFPQDEYIVLNEEFGMHPNLSGLADLFKSSYLDIYTNLGSENTELLYSSALNDALLYDGQKTWLNRFASNFERGNTIIEGLGCNTQFKCDSPNFKYVEFKELTLHSQLDYILKELKKGTSTKIFVINISGFDTHENQSIKLVNLYAEISNLFTSFQREIGALGMEDRVSTLLFSEMGRSIEENTTAGTEHANGATALLIGNGASGKIYKPDTMLAWTEFYSKLFTKIEFNKSENIIS